MNAILVRIIESAVTTSSTMLSVGALGGFVILVIIHLVTMSHAAIRRNAANPTMS